MNSEPTTTNEAELEAALHASRHLLDAPPISAEALERIVGHVRRAAVTHRRRRTLHRWTPLLSAAAAVLAALGLRGLPAGGGLNERDVLDGWVEAAADSSMTFTMLYELETPADPLDETDGERSLEAIDESLRALESVFGA